MLLGVGVAAGTLVIGGGLAVLVSFYDFPGRRWLDWALVLPLAIPGYVLVFVLVGQFSYAAPLQSSLFGAGLALPGLRGPVGAIGTLSATLYPYVYVLGRSAFLGQSRQSLEVARSLGRSYGRAVWTVALPLARPALAAGAALAVMEAGNLARGPARLPYLDRLHLPLLFRWLRHRAALHLARCWSAAL